METLAFTPNRPRQVLEHLSKRIASIQKPLTLSEVDLSESSEELDHLIGLYGGGHCNSFEFTDDNRKHGCRSLEYQIKTLVCTGAHDADGPITEKHTETIWVPVHDEMTLDQIARSVAKEIRDIEGNRFA